MNGQSTPLVPSEHRRVFLEDVAPESGLGRATSQEKPKAILLAGQPGAGKGRLADAAFKALEGDVVQIDPDELRKYHPGVDEFRKAHPYTWSGLTHADASQWADELLEATAASKKNLIFDTTLSNGEWASQFVRDLQARGYEVEVRAIAAHRLESELGVDERFAKQFDEKSFGRYVPEGARDAIYGKLPGSLDTIHAQTDVPIRIFNREGAELYDSRTSAVAPGQVLQDARESRLRDPKITRALSEDWKEQQGWHRDLPDAIARNPKVETPTAQHLLVERSELKVIEGVTRSANQASKIDFTTRIRPNVIKGASAVGAVATVYDAADTTHDVSRLRAQGNATAAQAQIERFATRNLGGWGGAMAGMGAGALAGVESGPGLLVTGTIGGVIGAVAGDQIADWINERKINRQADPQGNTWTFDPDHPEKGWTRIQRELDVSAMAAATVDMPIYQTRTLTADAGLSDRLTSQASKTATELALGSPPQSRDPYTLPAGERDTSSLQRAEWKHDAQIGGWTREVVTGYLDRGFPLTQPELATPERAAQLDAAAQAIVARNAVQTPAAMAAQYQAAYERHGWSQYGSHPEAVANAIRHPGWVVGSDGDLYERNAQGQWTHDGMLWDSQAQGNLRRELEATYQRQQADEYIPTLETVQARPGPELTQAASALPQTSASTIPEQSRSVAILQTGLIQLGYHHRVSQPLQVNGVNDDATRLAVASFQSKHELPVSGIFDQATQQALQQMLLAQQQAAEQRQAEYKAREKEQAEKEQTRAEAQVSVSHSNHPQHALYADMEQRFQGKGHSLSEAQLSALTLQMYAAGATPGWQGDVAVRNGEAAYVRAVWPPTMRAHLDLQAPAPSLQETMQAFTQQQALEQPFSRGPEGPERSGPGRSM